MMDIMASLFVEVHLSKVKLTLFCHGNCFLIASMDSEYSLWELLLSVAADGSTRSLRNALYDRCSFRFEIEFHGLSAKINPNMR